VVEPPKLDRNRGFHRRHPYYSNLRRVGRANGALASTDNFGRFCFVVVRACVLDAVKAVLFGGCAWPSRA
jgi:hypothetical protein